MTTAQTVIARAYRLTNEVGRHDTPSAEQYDDGLAALNELLDSWRQDNDIDLGLYSLTVESTVPNEYVRHLRYNLAIELAAESGLQVQPIIIQQAAELKAELTEPEIPDMEIDSVLLANSGYSWDIAVDR